MLVLLLTVATTAHATHVIVDQLPQRLPDVNHVLIDRALTIADSRWSISAVIASGAAAIATAVLAFLTWRSLGQTKQLVAGETLRLQTENTTRLMNDYQQVSIYQSPNAHFSAHVAASQIMNMSREHLEVMTKRLHALPRQIQFAEGQAVTASIGFSGSDELGLKDSAEQLAESLQAEYKLLNKAFDEFANSVGIFDNFFKNAHHLLAKDLLNVGLFDLAFAVSYLETRKALDDLGDLLPIPLGNPEIHDELRAHFKSYLEGEIQSGLAVDDGLARLLWEEELTATSSESSEANSLDQK